MAEDRRPTQQERPEMGIDRRERIHGGHGSTTDEVHHRIHQASVNADSDDTTSGQSKETEETPEKMLPKKLGDSSSLLLWIASVPVESRKKSISVYMLTK